MKLNLIEFLKFHFQGGQFLLYHFFWLRIHDKLTWKRSIIPNFWILVKIYLSMYLSREFVWKWGFQKTPFPISLILEILYAVYFDMNQLLYKISSFLINSNVHFSVPEDRNFGHFYIISYYYAGKFYAISRFECCQFGRSKISRSRLPAPSLLHCWGPKIPREFGSWLATGPLLKPSWSILPRIIWYTRICTVYLRADS
jgi:hypothetical protein